jgi:serine/threonine protein kinase
MSYLSDFDHTKLDAHIFPDGVVVETVTVSDTSAGLRKVQKTKVWKVERALGRGGYGEVRLETCAEDNKKRAVKRIWTSGSNLKKEYERELKALLEFSKPKYKEAAVFVEFFGWFEDTESVYLVMEYVPLGDLEDNVPPKAGAIKEPEIRDITVQILEGLKIMHQEAFVHRDLKPKVGLRYP